MTTTIELSADQRKLVTDILAAEVKIEQWEATAGQRWFAANVVTDGEGNHTVTDQPTNGALCALYCDKKVAKAQAEKGEKLTEEETTEVIRRAKNIWKNRRKEVRAAVEGGGDQMVTGSQRQTVKGETERRGDTVAAMRRWFAANDQLTDADILAAWADARKG